MKRILLLLLIGLSSNLIIAQDIILKLNGDEIKSKVLEISSETIKYKEFDFQDGPTRIINISDVHMIIYESGRREIFTTLTSQRTQEDSDLNNGNQGDYFTLGVGLGNSYGDLGLRIQYRMGGKQSFGFHAGIGYTPDAAILTSVGVKFFPSRNFYLNTQFGLTGTFREWYHIGGWWTYDDYYLYGPSFLVGGDWLWGRKKRFGLNAGFGITYHINWVDDPISPALDLGFVVRF